MVFHCIFRHFGKPGIEKRLWNLSRDIAVEHMIDGIYHRSVRYSRSLLRRETYRLLEKEKEDAECRENLQDSERRISEREKNWHSLKKSSTWTTINTGQTSSPTGNPIP